MKYKTNLIYYNKNNELKSCNDLVETTFTTKQLTDLYFKILEKDNCKRISVLRIVPIN